MNTCHIKKLHLLITVVIIAIICYSYKQKFLSKNLIVCLLSIFIIYILFSRDSYIFEGYQTYNCECQSCSPTDGGGTSSTGGGGGTTWTSSTSSGGTSSTGDGGGGGGGGTGHSSSGDFPSYSDLFTVQYRNSTDIEITIWSMFTQPPCAQGVSGCTNSVNGRDAWKNNSTLQTAFATSGTKMLIDGVSTTVNNSVNLLPGSVLTIIPPIKSNAESGKAGVQWYWDSTSTAGVNGWATPRYGTDGSETSMGAPENTMLFEYNLASDRLWWDMSSVDGINVNATMETQYSGDDQCDGGGGLRSCGIYPNLDECPYEITVTGNVKTCGNPKHLSQSDGIALENNNTLQSDLGTTPTGWSAWDTTATDCGDYCDGGSNKDLAGAASGDSAKKKAYHIWWSTNQIGTTYLDWLQRSGANKPVQTSDPVTCQTYGWAYDEMKWKTGDTFSGDGNPVNPDGTIGTNSELNANVSCGWDGLLSLNIDILYIMQ